MIECICNQPYIMKTLTELKYYNEQYRLGNPLISDEEYDSYAESLTDDEMSQLMDPTGKVRHKFIIGSLKKLKHDEPKPLSKWLDESVSSDLLMVAAKIDGMSIVAEYKNGSLVKATTRGDGYLGENQTDKVNIICSNVDASFTGTIRGELTLTFDSFEKLKLLVPDRDHKNLRNSTVGIINSKNSVTEEMVNLVHLYAYEIIECDGDFQKMTRKAQYDKLSELGFEVPVWAHMGVKHADCKNLTTLYKQTCSMSPYMVDGLVLCDDTLNTREDEYYPKNIRAFKVNDEYQWTTVTKIDWNLSKTGALAPVVIFEPIQLVGTTVKRASGYNLDHIIKSRIDVGAKVKVIKSGDIIPRIIEVESKTVFDFRGCTCPGCGGSTHVDGVHLHCSDPSCHERQLMLVESFILKLGVEGASSTTLARLGIMTFDNLLTFQGDNGKREQMLTKEIQEKLFHVSIDEITKALYWDGAGSRTVQKLMDHFGGSNEFWNVFNGIFEMPPTLPSGIGQKTIDKMMAYAERNMEIVLKIMSSPRRSTYRIVPKVLPTKPAIKGSSLEGYKITITGKTSTPRKDLARLYTEHGAEIVSFSKKTTHLVCGGRPGPAKLKKAEAWDVTVLDENEVKIL